MPGEPTGFDVTLLQLIETDLAGATFPSNVVDRGETFTLQATVVGPVGNPDWDTNLPAAGAQIRADFYAEGMGPGVPNPAIGGPVTVPIAAGPILIASPASQINTDGVYRCGVVVSIVVGGAAWRGWVAFNENCVIQVSWRET